MAGQVCGVSQDIVPRGATDRGSAADSLRAPGLTTGHAGRERCRTTVILAVNGSKRRRALLRSGSRLVTVRVMWRRFALIWLSLSLAIASGPAFAARSPDCPKAPSSSMADGHDGMAGTHGDMDCRAENCSPDCAAVCPGTIMPSGIAAVEPAAPMMDQRAARASTMPRSTALAATDPPPRTIFS